MKQATQVLQYTEIHFSEMGLVAVVNKMSISGCGKAEYLNDIKGTQWTTLGKVESYVESQESEFMKICNKSCIMSLCVPSSLTLSILLVTVPCQWEDHITKCSEQY